MSTMLADRPGVWLVSTVSGPGGRRKIPRGAVAVPKGDKAALQAEIVRQADAARKIYLLLMEEDTPGD